MNYNDSKSFYFFDIDDNLLFLPTLIYLWNAETRTEKAISSGEFARVQLALGREGIWQSWAVYADTFRDFRDNVTLPVNEQVFIKDLQTAIATNTSWQGPSWPLLIHAAANGRPIAMVTARGHAPATIEAGLRLLVAHDFLAAVPPILGIYTVSNPEIRALVGAEDPAMTVPSAKKLAIKHAVATALEKYGADLPHRFGMSDDDPNNVALAISAMRDCKKTYPDKRFFVINTNHEEYVKLEVFPMADPVTAAGRGRGVLSEPPAPVVTRPSFGGNASVYVTDIERAINFYTERLGLTLRVRVGTGWAELDAGNGLVIGLHIARPPETVTAGTRGAINIELAVSRPLDEVVAELKECDVTFRGDIQNYPDVRLATLLDPDNNEILLAQVLDTGEVTHAS